MFGICGGPKDILRKIRNKTRQKSLMESYGTGSMLVLSIPLDYVISVIKDTYGKFADCRCRNGYSSK